MSDFHPCCPPPTGLVRPVRVDPDGISGPTRGAAAGPRWRTSSHGLMVPASAPRSVEQRILEAAVALAAWVVDLDRLREAAGTPRRLPTAASYALDRACAECRSPKESQMLQVWEGDLDLPRPLMNREVLDLSGRVIAVVDLLEEQSGTYGEYNGASHRSRERQRRDEARADALRRAGLEGFVLVAGDSERVWRERMQSARARAPPLPDEDEAAFEALMLEHYRCLE